MKWNLNNYYLQVGFNSLGGALSSIRDREGKEYLWQGDPKFWSGQAPVLFPICGSLREDRARLADGRYVQMPRHGIVRKREFTCDFCSEDTVQFSLQSDGVMQDQFPWKFRLVITYRLSGKKIEVQYSITNQDATDMPFFIGGHPGFRCPILPGESFEDYQIEFEREEHLLIPEAVTQIGLLNMSHRRELLNQKQILPLNHELFYEDALTLDGLRSRKVRLCHKKEKRGVEIDFHDFPYLILWSSVNDGPFVAIEPWSGLSTCDDEDDVFEHKRNVRKAAPWELVQLGYTIEVIQNP